MEFIDHSAEVFAALGEGITAGLMAIGMTGERIAKENLSEKLNNSSSGDLMRSIQFEVEGNRVVIGTNSDHAIYVELGTGIYYAGGRDTPWHYQDAKGNWHTTRGLQGKHYLAPVADHKDEFRNILIAQLQAHLN